MQQQRLDEAYAFCEAVCRNASTTFYSSFSALNIDKRRAVHAVYALCRWVDDIVDGDEEPTILETKELREATEARQLIVSELHAGASPSLSPDEHRRRMMALVDIRLKLERASEQNIGEDDHPIFVALQDVFTRYPIQLTDFETVIEGMEDDLYPVHNQTWDELRSYCYKVASAVGLILIEIYGYEDRAARLHAIDLGIQMQLINVLRDINEDMGAVECTSPWTCSPRTTSALTCSSPKTSPTPSHGRVLWSSTLMSSSDIRHQPTNSSGSSTAGHALQPEIMADAYTSILNEIVRRSGDVFTHPVKLSWVRKALLGLRLSLRKARARLFA